MKTLNELWLESGEKPGLKVTIHKYKTTYFIVMGKAPLSGFYGYDNLGVANFFIGERPEWQLYQEPAPEKKKYWPAVLKWPNGHMQLSVSMYATEQEAKEDHPTSFIRLATEYPGIEL